MVTLDDLLKDMVQKKASDLHIKVGSPPGMRINGALTPVPGMEPLTPDVSQRLIFAILTEEQRKHFLENNDLDLAYSLPGVSRFRVNVMRQRGSIGAVLRIIPVQIPNIDDLGLPEVCKTLAMKPRGLVLVTGPTGSGKSTTLAAMLDYINDRVAGHIVTMEDPIEFVHRDKKCYVNQREIGQDTATFTSALKRVLRQDPDIILIGEMRDLETISMAITAAETGHLVFGTLHTTGAIQTVDRIIDVFPPEQQQQIRMQLSVTLQGVVSQTLLPKIGGGRICAMEIMIAVDAVRSLIREAKTPQLVNIVQTGSKFGMQTLEQCMADLVKKNLVTYEEAVSKSSYPNLLDIALGKTTPAAASAQTTGQATRPTPPPPGFSR